MRAKPQNIQHKALLNRTEYEENVTVCQNDP